MVDRKMCKKCCETKLLSEFQQYKVKENIGYRSFCEVCFLERKRQSYQKNKESILAQQAVYREENKSEIRKKDNEYKRKNKAKIRKQQKEYEKNNKDKIRQKKREYERNRLKTDDLYKLRMKIKNTIRHSFKRKGIVKNSFTKEILGCEFSEFKKHIESRLEPWMSWNNYGLYNGEEKFGWDLDHIVPVSSAITEEELIALNHHTNFQPLCSYVNRVIKINN